MLRLGVAGMLLVAGVGYQVRTPCGRTLGVCPRSSTYARQRPRFRSVPPFIRAFCWVPALVSGSVLARGFVVLVTAWQEKAL